VHNFIFRRRKIPSRQSWVFGKATYTLGLRGGIRVAFLQVGRENEAPVELY
jgi:hypothetical protein